MLSRSIALFVQQVGKGLRINPVRDKTVIIDNVVLYNYLEFELCDYYLVRGNYKHFSVYPLVKKRGKLTQNVGKRLLEYNQEQDSLCFTNDIKRNMNVLARNYKAQNIIFFISLTCGISLNNATNMKILDENSVKENYCLYDFLRAYQRYYLEHCK